MLSTIILYHTSYFYFLKHSVHYYSLWIKQIILCGGNQIAAVMVECKNNSSVAIKGTNMKGKLIKNE